MVSPLAPQRSRLTHRTLWFRQLGRGVCGPWWICKHAAKVARVTGDRMEVGVVRLQDNNYLPYIP
jgi:hypothetical protein